MIASAYYCLCCFAECNASDKEATPLRRDTKTTDYSHAVGGIDVKAFRKIIDNKLAAFRANSSVPTAHQLRTRDCREQQWKQLTFQVSWIGLISQPPFGRYGTRYVYM